MLANVVFLFVVAALAWTFWTAAQPKPVFVVSLRNGQVRATHGAVTAAFLDHVKEVAAAGGIHRGAIAGYAHGVHIRLKFPSSFPETSRQQLRNWWATSGWPAPKCRESGRCS